MTAELVLCRSPAAIAADLRADGVTTVCHETIYRAVYGGELTVAARDCLRRRRPRRRGRQVRHVSIRPGLANISTRPAAANERAEIGHWEADLIIGWRNRSAVLTMIERVTRYGLAIDLPEGYGATAVLGALVDGFESVPAGLRKSVTFDQGSEWAAWPVLAPTYGLEVWFCDPHSPWQRGAIENMNGHLRFWLPRGQRLDSVGPGQLAHITGILNNQRRRSMGWETPVAPLPCRQRALTARTGRPPSRTRAPSTPIATPSSTTSTPRPKRIWAPASRSSPSTAKRRSWWATTPTRAASGSRRGGPPE